MGIAEEQKIPFKKKEEQKYSWSSRLLFPMASIAKSLSNVFLNIFDVLLGFCIFVIGISEVFGSKISWLFYILTFIISIYSFSEHKGINLLEKPKKQ